MLASLFQRETCNGLGMDFSNFIAKCVAPLGEYGTKKYGTKFADPFFFLQIFKPFIFL
jgi:hypothetical protein